MTWLSVFETILHAAEAAAQIAAPIVAASGNPIMGSLILQAANAAVGAEVLFPLPGSSVQKGALVQAQTAATVAVINSALAAQKKPPLPADTTDIVQQQVKVVVSGLKSVQQAVETAAGIAAPASVTPDRCRERGEC